VGTPVPFDIDDLLEKTSRTFALAIPLLPEPTRRSVSLAYLLFRIADTLEDATEWPRAERVAALAQLASACSETFDVDRATRVRERWVSHPPYHHAGYMELIGKMPELFAALRDLPEPARTLVMRHGVRTTEGMATIVMRGGEHGSVALRTLAELRDYCYLVAGIVGELLTELFVRDTPKLERQRADLDANALLFGEGLQLVNILKDERADAGDGRSYLPEGVARREVIDLARKDLDGAQHYIDALVRGGAPDGYVAFTSLCVNLAVASLDKLEALGPGAKLSREDVFGILSRVNAKSCFRK
jgi:farnesyl-diphosphate farnesyltransferase